MLPIWFVIFLLSLSVHETAHAWTAEKFGDPTSRYMGRVTLNPLAHIDPMGTILLPLIGFFTGAFMFGWAKPVPVDLSRLKDRRLGDICISIAGPVSNVILAIIFVIALKVLVANPGIYRSLGSVGQPALNLIETGITMNVVLAVFNMLPIPPLDGSHVLYNLLPQRAAEAYDMIRPYGFFILVGLMYTGVTSKIIGPILDAIGTVISG